MVPDNLNNKSDKNQVLKDYFINVTGNIVFFEILRKAFPFDPEFKKALLLSRREIESSDVKTHIKFENIVSRDKFFKNKDYYIKKIEKLKHSASAFASKEAEVAIEDYARSKFHPYMTKEDIEEIKNSPQLDIVPIEMGEPGALDWEKEGNMDVYDETMQGIKKDKDISQSSPVSRQELVDDLLHKEVVPLPKEGVGNDIVSLPRQGKLISDFSGEIIPNKKDVVWDGAVVDYGGYAYMNRTFILKLTERYQKTINLALSPIATPANINDTTLEKLLQLKNNLSTVDLENSIRVYGMLPQLGVSGGKYHILFSMMESKCLHKKFSDRAKIYNEIWVPSKFDYNHFSESIKDKPIKVMSLGVDTDLYKPNDKHIRGMIPCPECNYLVMYDIKRGKEKIILSCMNCHKSFESNSLVYLKSFVFLALSAWGYRKGFDALLKAYFKAFTKEDDVSLLIVSRCAGLNTIYSAKKIQDDIAHYAGGLDKLQNLAHISHCGAIIPAETLPVLYNTANCFVLLSRGESFSFPTSEAGSCEVPIITNRYGGQLDYCTDKNSYLIDIDGFEKAPPELSRITPYYKNMEFPKLTGKRYIDRAVETMRYVYTHESESKKKAQKMRKLLVEKFNWDVVTDRIGNRLLEI